MANVVVSPEDASLRYGTNSGIGLVIAIEDVLALLPELETRGIVRFRPGYLGIRLSPDGAGEGVRIVEVLADTGAAAAGLRVGDVIREVNGAVVTDGLSLRQVLYALAPGTTVVLTVDRGDESLSIEVVLSLRPEFRR
jgi:S1-C subfamily serine protease